MSKFFAIIKKTLKTTIPNSTNAFVVLTEEEYQVVAGAPQVQNEPQQ
jgi:hypothetical protein